MTVRDAIITVLVKCPGWHGAKEIYVLTRDVLPDLHYSTFRSNLTDLTVEEKVERKGVWGHYVYRAR